VKGSFLVFKIVVMIFGAILTASLALHGMGIQTAFDPLLNYGNIVGVTCAMAVAPFPLTPELTAISLAYKNPRYIADDALPRVPVTKAEFKYKVYDLGESFRIPQTKVGRTSKPNQVEIGFTELTSNTEDYGLDDPIPQSDIDNAPTGYNPQGRAAEQLSEYIALDRESRCASLIFGTAAYAASCRTSLSGNHQWNVVHADSDPIEDITVGLDACVVRPNIMVIGRPGFSKLSTNANILKAINKSTGDKGIATRQAIADLFELEEILVGEAWAASSKKGQAAAITRLWGKSCALIYRNRLADTRNGVGFGYTAQFGTRVSGATPDKDIGLRGGVVVRVGESVKELAVANMAGYLIADCVA
jgi:hypothetical protein